MKTSKTTLSVIKRSGTIAPFHAEKITAAISKAGQATGDFSTQFAEMLSGIVIEKLIQKNESGILEVEEIQDEVENVLMQSMHLKAAKAYIIYREKHRATRDAKKLAVDVEASVNEYLDRSDWRVSANANQGYSLGGLILNISGKVVANYWLNNIYPPEIGEAHRMADIHLHDLDMLSGYCAGWSLRTLLLEGLNGIPGRINSSPPKHLQSAIAQIVNFLGTLQNEWAGAQAFSSFDTYLAPFIRKDNLSYTEVKQSIQELIFNLNVPSRWGTQTPFTNLTFDWVCPDDLKNQVPRIANIDQPFRYGDLQTEMDMINKAYIEVMSEGDEQGRVFTFPIPTYNITPEFDWTTENATSLFAMTAKYGLPYFQNFMNSDLSPNMVRSMCCRLQLDLRELLKRGNGLFGSAEQTGSLGVVTINCARLGYQFKGDWDALYKRLDYLLDISRNSLEIKRKTIQKLLDQGLFPYTKRYLGTLRNHFSTIGVNGIHEMIRNFTHDHEGVHTPIGKELAENFMDHIRERIRLYQEETGHMYNLEATPAEGTTYRFAKEDKRKWKDILQAGSSEHPYYTNSSQLPVEITNDPFFALDMQETLQAKYTGGTVMHLYMQERISDAETCKKLVKRVLENYRIPYLTITPTFSICPKHGYLNGEHEFCPKCDQELLDEQNNNQQLTNNEYSTIKKRKNIKQ